MSGSGFSSLVVVCGYDIRILQPKITQKIPKFEIPIFFKLPVFLPDMVLMVKNEFYTPNLVPPESLSYNRPTFKSIWTSLRVSLYVLKTKECVSDLFVER